MKPSEYLGLKEGDFDPNAQRAFILACALTSNEREAEQAKKNRRKKR